MPIGTKKIGRTREAVATAVDVARLAGVTQPTVSRAINDPQRVAINTRERIRRAMAVLNYRPSSVARGLARGQHGIVGLLIRMEKGTADRMGLMTLGVGRAVSSAEYLLSIAAFPLEPAIEELAACPLVSQHSCDGIVVDLETTADLREVLSTITVPYVMVNPAEAYSHDAVFPNDSLAAQMAVEHLISEGHRRIAYISAEGHATSCEARRQGYEMTMYRNDLKPLPIHTMRRRDPHDVAPPDASREQRMREVDQIVDALLAEPHPPTAIITYNGYTAVILNRVAYQRNWRIPDEFSVVSCDDNLSLDRLSPRITAVDSKRDVVGSEAVRMLVEKVSSPETPLPSTYVDGVLRRRDSVLTLRGA